MRLAIQALIAIGALALCAQPGPGPKPAALKVIEIRGEITAVNLTPGGMPSVEVAGGGTRKTIRLGSIRYLMANNFNPKAGQKVTVRAFELEGVGLVALSIETAPGGQKLILRDENGQPLWRRGMMAGSAPRY